MTKLNDIQLILLTNASARGNGSLLPAAASIADASDRLTKAITLLAKRGLAEERPATDAASAWRLDRDERFGMFITDSGRAAIKVEADEASGPATTSKPAKTTEPNRSADQERRGHRLLHGRRRHARRDGRGDGLAASHDPSGPHGVKKKGHVIDKGKRGERLLPHHPPRLTMAWSMTNWLHWRPCRRRSCAPSGRGVTGGPLPRITPRCCVWLLPGKSKPGVWRVSRTTQQKLDQHKRGKTRTSPAQPGMRLPRVGRGAHVVLVGENEVIRWDGRSGAR